MQRLPIEFVDLRATGRHTLRIALNRDRDDRYSQRLRDGQSSSKIVKLLLSLSAKGDAVIDAGANVGTISAPLAAQDRRVLAIEAMAENYVLLVETAIVNGLRSLVPVHAAVAATPGLLEIVGYSAFARVKVDDEPGSTPAVTIDALARAHGVTDATALKIDVEGSEIDALTGAGDLLASESLKTVVYEANGAHCVRVGHRPAAIAQRLAERGFDVFTLHGTTMVPMDETLFQAVGNVDCLAVRPGARPPSGYRVGSVDHATQVKGAVAALSAANHGYRKFMVEELRHAPEPIRSADEVRAALAGLRDDESVAAPIRSRAEDLLGGCDRLPAPDQSSSGSPDKDAPDI